LPAVRPDVVYPGHRECPTARGDQDEAWLPVVGARGWCVLMRDKRIRYRRPVERDKLTAHGVRAFVLTGAGNSTRWEMFRLLVLQSDRLEELAATPAPFIYAVTGGGVRRIGL
jgi:PIN like domain